MISISLPYILSFSEKIEPLATISTGTKFADVYLLFLVAEVEIQMFIDDSVFSSSIRSSRQSALDLIASLKAETSNNTELDRVLSPLAVVGIQRNFQAFKIALIAELNVAPAYFVGRKDPFDALVLLENGASIFSSDLATKVPESLFDAVQAAKAFAFELPTACGFHLFRVVESVLRRYYLHVSSGTPTTVNKVRSIGVYVKKMRTLSVGKEVILAALDQLASLHRNPLIHPDAALTSEDAMVVLGLARSVVSSMLVELPVLPRTTSNIPVQT